MKFSIDGVAPDGDIFLKVFFYCSAAETVFTKV